VKGVQQLLKLQLPGKDHRFDRERIPERVVHAREPALMAFLAYGTIGDEPANKNACQAFPTNRQNHVCSFSTVIHGGHSPETLRDPRGFATKFTPKMETGIWWEITRSFLSEIKFPDLVHAFKPDPVTNRQDPNRILILLAIRLKQCI